MSAKTKLMVKSYLRALAVVWMGLLSAGVTKWEAYAAGVVVAVISPALRWLDGKDGGFGRVIDAVQAKAQEVVDEATTEATTAVKPVRKRTAPPAVPKG